MPHVSAACSRKCSCHCRIRRVKPKSTAEIAELVQVSLSTVQRCVDEGFEAAVICKPSPQRQYRKRDGVQEAKLIVLACSEPPAGRLSWTMQLLADRLVELEIADSIGREAVRTTLKKTCSNRGSTSRRPHQTQTPLPVNSARLRH